MNRQSAGRRLDDTDATAIADAVGSPRIGGLDFLRAVAVTFVIFDHAVDGRPTRLPWLGDLGLAMFFVLSGFLITRLLLDEHAATGRIRFLAFYRRRIARLMPVFYLYLAASLAISWLRGRPIPSQAIWATVLYVNNYYQAFTGAAASVVSHCWSLAVEEQFYFLWPMLVVVALRRHASLSRTLLAIVLAVWCWRWYLLAGNDIPGDYLYRALETRADQLAVGCLLAVLVRFESWRHRLAAVVRLPGLVALIVLSLYLFSHYGFWTEFLKYGFSFMLVPLVMALLVLVCVVKAQHDDWKAAVLNNPLIVHVGKISYGMYLFHGLVGYSAARFVENYTGMFLAGLIAELVVVVCVASVLFQWFETPARRWIVGKQDHRVAVTHPESLAMAR